MNENTYCSLRCLLTFSPVHLNGEIPNSEILDKDKEEEAEEEEKEEKEEEKEEEEEEEEEKLTKGA